MNSLKNLISVKNLSIITTILSMLGGSYYQVYDWGQAAGKLSAIESGVDGQSKLEKENRRLKRKLRKCKNGSSHLPETEKPARAEGNP